MFHLLCQFLAAFYREMLWGARSLQCSPHRFMRYPILPGKLEQDSSRLSLIIADPKFTDGLVAPLKLKPTEVLRKVGYKA